MLFNSYIFILLFLPLTLLGYFGLNHFGWYKAANVFLIGMSLWFYGYFNPWYLFIICGSIVLNFALTKVMERTEKWKKTLLILGILGNVGVIFYYKYFNFFLENINALFGGDFTLKNILLPLGISFFTFQQISYLVDSYRGETKGYRFCEYALFVSFFPQLIAGPIVLHNELIPQFQDTEKRKLLPENFSKGLYIFALGLFKKVLIADTFAKAANFGFDTVETLSSLEAIIVALSYAFQLYFDFSGYCDMAIGIGHMFNLELPQNFNSPYRATSIVDFWDRWHMSLTRFLRTYIYFPLGGSRKGKIRTYGNIMIVFLVSGLWHGANWTFILWGGLHGLLNCLNRCFQKQWDKVGEVTRWAVTFLLVTLLWILFRAESVEQAVQFLINLCGFPALTVRWELLECFTLPEFLKLGELAIPGVLKSLINALQSPTVWILGALFAVLNVPNSKQLRFRPTVGRSLLTALLLTWSILSLSGVSVFLYFNF